MRSIARFASRIDLARQEAAAHPLIDPRGPDVPDALHSDPQCRPPGRRTGAEVRPQAGPSRGSSDQLGTVPRRWA
jgi:hypothetical protein